MATASFSHIGSDDRVGRTAAASESQSFDISPELRESIQVLVIDDDRTLREGCASMLQMSRYNASFVGRGDDALELLKRRRFDIVLCDLYMSGVPGMTLLRGALATDKDTLVIMMTGNPTVSSSIEALRAGAWDYLPKPFSATHLDLLLGRAAHAVIAARDTREMQRSLIADVSNSEKVLLLGAAPSFQRAVELARRVAQTDASVMIYGGSGTGKEVIAQFIHMHSRRASRKMVPINCAALPEPLLESEMFGHRKGAFTGADRDKPGLLETANGGTLFLDELTEMSHPLQAKLLRVLQDGVVRRVGSEQQDAVVDVRFISATNKDPQEAVNAAVLREDLFYRLRVVPIKLPPLRERLDDIPLLANHFLAQYWKRHRNSAAQSPKLNEDTIEFLRSRPWRGNVRELQNVIEHLAVLAEPRQEVRPEDVPFADGEIATPVVNGVPAGIMNDAYHLAKDRLVAHFEKEYLARLVARAGGNMSRAARLANIDRTTLYRLMEKHSFHRDELSNSFSSQS